MSIEQTPDLSALIPTPEQLTLMIEILAAWNQLPLEEQFTMSLGLLEWVMDSELGQGMRSTIDLRWQPDTETIYPTFALVKLRQSDLKQVGFTENEVAQFSEEDLKEIAQIIRDYFIREVFWTELRFIAEGFLDKKEAA